MYVWVRRAAAQSNSSVNYVIHRLNRFLPENKSNQSIWIWWIDEPTTKQRKKKSKNWTNIFFFILYSSLVSLAHHQCVSFNLCMVQNNDNWSTKQNRRMIQSRRKLSIHWLWLWSVDVAYCWYVLISIIERFFLFLFFFFFFINFFIGFLFHFQFVNLHESKHQTSWQS